MKYKTIFFATIILVTTTLSFTRAGEIHNFARKGNLQEVKNCIEKKKVSVDSLDKNNTRTALHWAAAYGHVAIVEYLLSKGANVNARDIHGATGLLYAVEHNKIEMVEFLLKNKSLPNIQTTTPWTDARKNSHPKGMTPLHIGAFKGIEKAIQLLLDHQSINPNILNDDGVSPLHYATFKKQNNAVKALLNCPKVNPNLKTTKLWQCKTVNNHFDKGSTPLHIATIKKHTDIIQLLAKHKKIDFNIRDDAAGRTPLHWAARCHMLEMVKALLLVGGSKVDVNTKNFADITPLHYAAQFNSTEMVKTLVIAGAKLTNLTRDKSTPLMSAVMKNAKETVAYLLTLPNINLNATDKYNKTALHYAAEKGFSEITKLLLAKNANANIKNNADTLPLHYTALNGHSNTTKLLIPHTTNIDALNIDGSPLHLACRRGHINIVKLLVVKGAKINIRENTKRNPGRTALLCAVENGHLNIVDFLLTQNKVNIELTDSRGNNGAHLACKSGKVKILERFANVSTGDLLFQKNNLGQIPLHYAALYGNDNIITFLSDFSQALQTTATGQDLDFKEKDILGRTALHLAIKSKKLSTVLTLIKIEPALLLLCDKLKNNILHYGVKSKNKQLLLKLVQIKPQLQFKYNLKHQTPLMLAQAKKSPYTKLLQ